MTASRAPAAAPMIIRRREFALSDEQLALQELFHTFFVKECPSERVRAAEPSGHDAELWASLQALRPVEMGLPLETDGDGAGLVELVIVAEEYGRALAPVPLIEAVVGARLAARLALPIGPSTSLALRRWRVDGRQLVASGAAVTRTLACDGAWVLSLERDEPPSAVGNTGDLALAWWSSEDATTRSRVVSTDVAAFDHAVDEWKLLTAAALVGCTAGALQLSVDYAKERIAFGVPIGSYQAISHPIADVDTALQGARHLVRKAAWFLEHEPDAAGALVPMAFAYATQSAELATRVGVHVQGGLGFTLESDMQLYFRRAKAWSNVAGDPRRELQVIADRLYGPVGSR